MHLVVNIQLVSISKVSTNQSLKKAGFFLLEHYLQDLQGQRSIHHKFIQKHELHVVVLLSSSGTFCYLVSLSFFL